MNDIAYYVGVVEYIYRYMIIIYVLMSWLPAVRESFIGELLSKLVEPYLRPFRRLIPPLGGMIDISPIVALIALYFIGNGLTVVLEAIF